MKIEELKQKGNVTVTEVKNGCVKVSADKGFILKGGDTYTSEIYCDKDAELQGYEVVAYSDYLRAENKKKYESKTLEEAKEMLLAEIDAYDTSSAVNAFYINGEQHWLDFNLRDRVFDGNERIAYKGREETSLWLDGKCFVMPIAVAQDLICTIEVYAKDCYNVTATHQAEVNKLTTIEEVEAYNYKTGYPEKLNLKV